MTDSPAAGHNHATDERLASIVARIEKLREEKDAISEDIKEVYTEAKSAGYPIAALRALIAERAKDQAKAEELAADLDMLRAALGAISDLPLGQAALGRA